MPERTDYYINKCVKGKKYVLEKYFSDEIHEFHKSLPGYSPTPLRDISSSLLALHPGKVYLKDESQRFSMGAFKSLGASWAIHIFLNENRGEFTFCTATDGNHGRAVAWSAKLFGFPAKVFMPEATVESRIRYIREEGAKVTIVSGNYDDAVAAAKKEAEKENHILIQDTSWTGYEYYPNLISAGYSTILRELENQLNFRGAQPFDAVILQSGVGSWAASTILYFSLFHRDKDIKFIILEPFESDCLLESAKNRKISVTQKSQDTIMAGLNCGTPSMSAWEVISDLTHAFISVDDSFSAEAIRILHNLGIHSCESGAAGLGGLLALLKNRKLSPVLDALKLGKCSRFLLFNTEGITDPEMYNKIINEGF